MTPKIKLILFLWSAATPALAVIDSPFFKPVAASHYKPLVAFANAHFSGSLPEEWRKKLTATAEEATTGWQVFQGDLGAKVAIALCQDKIVQLYAMGPPLADAGGLKKLIADSLSPEAKAHLEVVADNQAGSYFLLKDKKEAAPCGK